MCVLSRHEQSLQHRLIWARHELKESYNALKKQLARAKIRQSSELDCNCNQHYCECATPPFQAFGVESVHSRAPVKP
eukprot:2981620-Amphidinium_carterae.1